MSSDTTKYQEDHPGDFEDFLRQKGPNPGTGLYGRMAWVAAMKKIHQKQVRAWQRKQQTKDK